MDVRLDKNRTALLIADFYAEQMGKLPHAVDRKCLEKTLELRQAARAAGLLVCYSATVFRPGYVEVGERNKTFSCAKIFPRQTDVVQSAAVIRALSA